MAWATRFWLSDSLVRFQPLKPNSLNRAYLLCSEYSLQTVQRNGLDDTVTAWRHVGMTTSDKPLKGVPGLCRSCGHEYWVIAPEQMPLALDAASKLMLQTSCPRCGVGVNQIGMINRPPRDDREQATPQPADNR